MILFNKAFGHILSCTLLFVFFSTAQSQVAIGTTTPDDGSAFEIESTLGAFVPPRMTDVQMRNIPTPLDGAVVYNTTTQSLFVFSNGSWKTTTNPTLVLNRAGGTVSTMNNTYYNFPLNSTHVQINDPTTFTISANGTIVINKTGTYAISASFSTSNIPSGSHKYIIGAYRNNSLVGYLSRGFVSVPGTGTDYFGASGILTYYLNAGDILELQYVLNNDNNPLNAAFFNIGITKMN
ncbi:hypothetical protein [Aequorivita vladivostokensis]|uniref:C1q domain-containing protein n=1 Tax=Aequorivita vladivostokensis TaxID=171194 RepID=A0ABR5DGU7_9FLAO|nr:hypothetical protein [Aequorivita vladivostokensis]KJJ37987.1 hypothetical protein MB09_11810 [Aequorivita vladivostokensis]